MSNRRINRPQNDVVPKIRVSPKLASGMTDYRKNQLEDAIENGLISEGGQNYANSNLKRGISEQAGNPASDKLVRGAWENSYERGGVINKSGNPSMGAIVHSSSFYENQEFILRKKASVVTSGSTSSSVSGQTSFDRMVPEVYSPLFTMANLNLPRDRLTINAWIRNYYDLNPIVRNAITLHATYPISKLNIKCQDRKVLQFFEDMVEEMDLLHTLGMVSLEFWKLGEVFPYAELNESSGKWSKIVVQNPDYILVKRSALAGQPIISMRPDEVLRRLALSNNPADVHLRKQIPEKILHYVRQGKDIPLDNFNISHLKMLSSPYDLRGQSIIVSIFKDLSLYDKLRECFSIDTEILTENGFKFYDEITEIDKLATLNKDTNHLEYQNFTNRIRRKHNDEMYHFIGQKIDTMVTPNHRMWLSKAKSHGGYNKFNIIEAKDVLRGCFYKFQCVANYIGKEIEEVDILGNKIPVEDYLKILGHLISEGCIHYNENTYQYSVSLSQREGGRFVNSMKNSMEKLAKYCKYNLGINNKINTKGFSKNNNCKIVEYRIARKNIANYFANEIGTLSYTKKIPMWVKELSPRLLKILLNSLVEGDAHIGHSKYNDKSVSYRYTTISKQLANDVQEIAFKAGYAPVLYNDKNGQGKSYYAVSWSNTAYGRYPTIYGNNKKLNGSTYEKVQYNGDVFCFEVPNGLLVTRRNGKISIQGNCKFAQADGLVNPVTVIKVGGNSDGDYRATQEDLEHYRQIFEEAEFDKNAKIITHAGVTVERVGASGATLDVAGDIEHIIKNIYTGLMVPPAIIDTESAVYASASIGLEVLRQRYFNFRNMIAKWLQNKIFAPISEIQEFWEYKDGKKKLIVPEIEWNQMNLYDLQDYIGNITGLLSQKQVSLQTVYRSLGLNYEEERVKIRQESINDMIKVKEEQALAQMTLTELRGVDPEKDILEPVDSEQREAEAGVGAGAGMGGEAVPGGMPNLGGGPELGGPEAGGMPELSPPAPELPAGGAPAGGPPSLGPGM